MTWHLRCDEKRGPLSITATVQARLLSPGSRRSGCLKLRFAISRIGTVQRPPQS
ncbi:hypothetical protein [Faecalibaculum rodentium]|uniref:hypothetical protein n=1 Tax=Faecalibaculum rodentium TaxID=1702221 RepID=UPI0026092080|nr:hypothetical protein [Faecalibaculum rodentium]